jgi:hypothetical protein
MKKYTPQEEQRLKELSSKIDSTKEDLMLAVMIYKTLKKNKQFNKLKKDK